MNGKLTAVVRAHDCGAQGLCSSAIGCYDFLQNRGERAHLNDVLGIFLPLVLRYRMRTVHVAEPLLALLSWLSSSGGILAMRDEAEAPAMEPWRRRLSSPAWYLADADAQDISSAALAKDDIKGMSSGGSTGGPLSVGAFVGWLFLRPPGTEYDEGGMPLDDATPLPLLPRTRTVAGKAGGSPRPT